MNIDLAVELRAFGDNLAAEHQYKRCALAYQAAHMIEHQEEKIKELEGMLEDSDHFRDHWYERYIEMKEAFKSL
mgnify:CR=1 FL=1